MSRPADSLKKRDKDIHLSSPTDKKKRPDYVKPSKDTLKNLFSPTHIVKETIKRHRDR